MQADIALDNMRRIQWLTLVVLLLNLLHAWLFSGTAASETDTAAVGQWRHGLFLTHLLMAGAMALLGALARVLSHWGEAAHRWQAALTAGALLSGLAFAVAVVVIDQWVTPNITPFLIGCALTGTVLLVRPLLAALIFGSACAGLVLSLGLTQTDPSTLMSNRLNGLTAAVLGWFLSAMTWRKTTVNLLLARQLAERQAELEAKQNELATLATRDSLTGLLNRPEMLRLADAELARARRYQHDTSLLLIDLDHFKRVNDEHGHPAGDAVLAATAQALQHAVRQSDVLARLGGEEFMVLLPQTGREAAGHLADKLRRQLAGHPMACGGQHLSVTCSVGVATVTGVSGEDFQSLYHRCDKALYRAKAAGRNRVEVDA